MQAISDGAEVVTVINGLGASVMVFFPGGQVGAAYAGGFAGIAGFISFLTDQEDNIVKGFMFATSVRNDIERINLIRYVLRE